MHRKNSDHQHRPRVMSTSQLGGTKGSSNNLLSSTRKRATIVVSDPMLDESIRSTTKSGEYRSAMRKQSRSPSRRSKDAEHLTPTEQVLKKSPSLARLAPKTAAPAMTTFREVGNMVEEVVVVDEGEELLLREAERLTDIYNSYGGIRTQADLMRILDTVGQHVSERECAEYCCKVGYESGRTMTLNEFLEVIRLQKTKYCDSIVDDTTEAFLAVSRGTDSIAADDLRILVRDFKLTVDIERLLEEADEDGSGVIEFDEFQAMLAAVGAGLDDELDTPRSSFFRSSFVSKRRTSSFTVKKSGMTRRNSLLSRRNSLLRAQVPESELAKRRRQSLMEVTAEETFDPFQFRKSLAVAEVETEAAFTPEDWYQRQKVLHQREAEERRRAKSTLPYIDPKPQIEKYRAKRLELLSNPRKPWGVRHSDSDSLASARLPELQKKRLSPISEPRCGGVISSLSPPWRVAYSQFIHRPPE
jgi:calmodulin